MERRRHVHRRHRERRRRPTSCRRRRSRYHEQRYAGVLTGGYKPGLYGAQATATLSDEPDYISIGGGLALTADLNDKLTTPRVAFNHDHDEIGRGPNNFISHARHHRGRGGRHDGAHVARRSSSLTATGQFERGDQSKPYRYVPMFDPSVAPFIPPGASIDLVNEYRSNVRPLEQLPIVARPLRRRPPPQPPVRRATTLRIDERIYYDSWQLKATTTDVRYVIDLGEAPPPLAARRASTRRRARTSTSSPTAPSPDPQPRAGDRPALPDDDRELSPLITLTGGGGARLALGCARGEDSVGPEPLGRHHVHEVLRRALHHVPHRGLRRDRDRRGVRVMRARAISAPLSGLARRGARDGASSSPSCADPVHDAGGRVARPGEPAASRRASTTAPGSRAPSCHGPEGPAKTQFSIAGTIFWQPVRPPTDRPARATGSVGYNNAYIVDLERRAIAADLQQLRRQLLGDAGGVQPGVPRSWSPSSPNGSTTQRRVDVHPDQPRHARAPSATATRRTTTRSGTSTVSRPATPTAGPQHQTAARPIRTSPTTRPEACHESNEPRAHWRGAIALSLAASRGIVVACASTPDTRAK